MLLVLLKGGRVHNCDAYMLLEALTESSPIFKLLMCMSSTSYRRCCSSHNSARLLTFFCHVQMFVAQRSAPDAQRLLQRRCRVVVAMLLLIKQSYVINDFSNVELLHFTPASRWPICLQPPLSIFGRAFNERAAFACTDQTFCSQAAALGLQPSSSMFLLHAPKLFAFQCSFGRHRVIPHMILYQRDHHCASRVVTSSRIRSRRCVDLRRLPL